MVDEYVSCPPVSDTPGGCCHFSCRERVLATWAGGPGRASVLRIVLFKWCFKIHRYSGKNEPFFPFSLFLGVLPRLYQACYGILKVPEGSWLCRTCALGVQPKCLLCPKRGGALKPTRSGTKWVHVSCALWIPEVGRHEGGQPWGIGMGSSPGEVGLRGTQNSSSTR